MLPPVLPALAVIDPLELALEGVVPALVVAALALGLSQRAWSRNPATGGAGSAWGMPLALGVGFFATFRQMLGWPVADWYPDMKTRVAWLALAAAAFGLAQAGAQQAWRVATALFLAGASVYLLAHWRLQDMWDWPTTLAWIGGSTVAGTLLALGLESLAVRRKGVALPLAWMLATGLAAQAYFLAHSENYARMASGLAAALGVAFVVALRKPQLTLARGGTLVFTCVYGGLALAANRTADLPGSALALLLLAPLCAWGVEVPGLKGRSSRARALAAAVFVLVPVGLALLLTTQANPSTGADAYLESLGG